ncbi:MAG: hypothetical protein HC834_03680 [Rhodospirillales bacterium]|nr:hypothetical protein [Rhodospirillales bacterium]
MDAAFNRFVCLLKRNGVRVSPSETIDAMQALLRISVAERATVKTVLQSTLIKNAHDIPVFEELFEVFFGLPTRPGPLPTTTTTIMMGSRRSRIASSWKRTTKGSPAPTASMPTAIRCRSAITSIPR